ncbi:Hypothetical protein Cp1002B_1183 [Corynebacterium pseudotuberculosis]|nr:Hypothetical protein CpPAT10_1472a [Corynebacterium pseudotuberculosis PAT10]AFF22627.1 Hypothetical protein CpP54B96_1499 [Corynebacterium pseudotuberculosis P54B96]AFH52424.1 Hypothetical protein Cp267_1535 [Corynebacterium pseudotuberculosis 267]AJC14208.1 Hypothetical protein CpVD57_1503 [Corynebacterium pseudotuberculosis]AKJ56154.1 Hypothetical protein Cp12C_1552 [Corynebacterium pseudotuberculosis]
MLYPSPNIQQHIPDFHRSEPLKARGFIFNKENNIK